MKENKNLKKTKKIGNATKIGRHFINIVLMKNACNSYRKNLLIRIVFRAYSTGKEEKKIYLNVIWNVFKQREHLLCIHHFLE